MPFQSLLFSREPGWRENRPGLRHRLPENVASWIYEAGSLTRRLRSYYGSAVKVEVVYQRWLTPFLSERKLLGQAEHRYCMTREVMLHANGMPLILARTIMPKQTIRSAHRNLSRLGSRPLGEVIFSYPDIERLDLQVTALSPSAWSPKAVELGAIRTPVWGRRTVYAIMHQPLLVNEFFMPGALAI
ncbi:MULTISPECIES: chorismate--pyruvate lyase family protein [Methylomicrobium]|uniref:Probable chorismate pyruvate-lyase n=1 Tax=Methylomicrobium album BG8 TaxID=686340 RepID=H8GMR8_METAL|nr:MULTISPECIES: chorismate lyase [Methylomicrobium]EIC29470.1 4-hydroxybenzoate synthetase (chorismate lyase) [Methylomicrobium album BG8]